MDLSPSSTERTLSSSIHFLVVGMSGQWYKFIAACQLSGICWQYLQEKWVVVFKYLSANMAKGMNTSVGFAMTFSFALKSCLPLIKKLIRLLKLAVHLYHCIREIHFSFSQSLCRISPFFPEACGYKFLHFLHSWSLGFLLWRWQQTDQPWL